MTKPAKRLAVKSRGVEGSGSGGRSKSTGPDPHVPRLEKEIARLAKGPVEGRVLKRIGDSLATLHSRFVSEAAPDGPRTDYQADATSLAAYLAYFFPSSVGQVARALAEVSPPESKRWRVLDVGSGPGPAAMAVAAWARANGRSTNAVALDASAEALDSLRRIWPDEYGNVETRLWTVDEALPDGEFDVIVASHFFNEIHPGTPNRLEAQANFGRALARKLAPGGLLVLVEPALKRTGRELLVLRDRLLGEKLTVLAPCLFQGHCPAIQRPRDWCHGDRPWEPPELVVRVGEAAGVARVSLKSSYVIFGRTPVDEVRTRDTSLFRIVSEPLPEKGKLRFFGCGAAGRHPLVRLDRDAADRNAAFDSLERGDVVRFGSLVASGDGRRLGKETDVVVEVSATSLDLPR